MSIKHLLLSVISGILISLSWYEVPTALIILIAFVPLLIVEYEANKTQNSIKKVMFSSLITFLIWNLLVTYWISGSTVGGAIMAIVANSLVMTLFFTLYHICRKKVNIFASQYTLIPWWLTFEFVFYHTEIAYTWLHLGYSFANVAPLVQWYEFTGVLGGTLLILFVNITVTQIYAAITELRVTKKFYIHALITILLPLFIFSGSYIWYLNIYDKGDKVRVVIVQPNIDPWLEKFERMTVVEQLNRVLMLASQKITSETQLLVAPETAITENMWENYILETRSSIQIFNFLQDKPDLAVIIGASTYKQYGADEKISYTARKFIDTAIYYDRYNTALQYDNTKEIQIYHKSKLVVGVEMMPYPKYLKFLEKISIDLGGTVGSLGVQEEPGVFHHKNIISAPIICYESVFGEYVSKYVRKGANLLTIITNDGWWGDTPGYKQHLSYARLRAIENRRSIARSANTGISCFINQRGDISQPTKWWIPDAITEEVNLNSEITFYTRNGDYIGRIAGCLTLLMIIFWILHTIKNNAKFLNKF